jgi:hypothetical protein
VQEDYSDDSPPAWRTALNLLLVAATLKPMILAPSTSAATVAGYLHLDDKYLALYGLVQKLRGLSAKLVGFRIDPNVLRKARGEAAIRAELQALNNKAKDWLSIQAPAHTINFAQATSVWRHWIRPGGEIEALVTPVVHNRIEDAPSVHNQLIQMSDVEYVYRLIHTTDRRVLKRKHGDEIYAGARDHLLRLVDEALGLPRQWLSLVDLLGGRGDRLRDLLEEAHTAMGDNLTAIERELQVQPGNNTWSLVNAGQKQALCALQKLQESFSIDQDEEPSSDPQELAVLGRPLLLVPKLPISENWEVEAEAGTALTLLEDASLDPEQALSTRLERGDCLGADMMIDARFVNDNSGHLRVQRDRWKKTVETEIEDCRRLVEIGLAYGYLTETERGDFLSQLDKWKAQLDEQRRFDVVVNGIRKISDRLGNALEERKKTIQEVLCGIDITDALQQTFDEAKKALDEGDITTANEYVHWLQQGKPSPSIRDEENRDGLDDFFPTGISMTETWLAEHTTRKMIEDALRQGQTMFPSDTGQVNSALAVKIYSAWANLKGPKQAEQKHLESLLTGLGLMVRELRPDPGFPRGHGVWLLNATPIEDRLICPLPTFGSSAKGRYRIICAWSMPSEEDLLQWADDGQKNCPTILLYFDRLKDLKWRNFSRLTKTKRRSILILDETLLVYLCCTAGSWLRKWLEAVTPFSYALPYDSTAGYVAPEMFYGRGAELEAVLGLNGRCFIYGGRQLGKR